MKKKSIRLVAIIAAFCVAFTSLPLLAGNLDASAMAKKKKVATKITLHAKADGQHKVKLSWNKIKKPEKGYAVFRDGRLVKHLGKKKLSFTDTGLEAGTTHYYQIKVYKTKKVKQWYNKATGQWQKKKPARKYRGKSRKVTTYTYKRPSKYVYITTVAAPKATAPASKPTTGGNTSTGGSDTSGSTSGGGNTPTPADTPTVETKTVTDYLGVTRTITKQPNEKYWYTSNDEQCNPMARYDRTVPGEFTVSGDHVMIQKNGVTFHIPTTSCDDGDTYRAMYVYMYNGDINKLDLTVRNTKSVTTHNYDRKTITETYVMADDKYRLAQLGYIHTVPNTDVHTHLYINKTDNLKIKAAGLDDTHCGFVSGKVNIDVRYHGEYIGTAVYNVNADPARAEALEIARKATANTNGYDADMQAIKKYMLENYKNSDSFECDNTPMSCVGGAYIIETWSIEKYNVNGSFGYGSCPPGSEDYGHHVAFYPEPDEQSAATPGRAFYEATGAGPKDD